MSLLLSTEGSREDELLIPSNAEVSVGKEYCWIGGEIVGVSSNGLADLLCGLCSSLLVVMASTNVSNEYPC